jgi:hypothetical protein
MATYEGIYENGVVRFPGPIALPEHTKVVVTIEPAPATTDEKNGDATGEQHPSGIGSNSKELYALLDERFHSGFTDTAARHNEHQP